MDTPRSRSISATDPVSGSKNSSFTRSQPPNSSIVNTTKDRRTAQGFLDFLRTDEAQKIYAAKGYRSVNPELVDAKTYPKPAKLFEIGKLGGWSKVNDEFFDPSTGKIAKVFQAQGKSTGG